MSEAFISAKKHREDPVMHQFSMHLGNIMCTLRHGPGGLLFVSVRLKHRREEGWALQILSCRTPRTQTAQATLLCLP